MADTKTRFSWSTPAIIAALVVMIGVCLLFSSQASAGGTPTISVTTVNVGLGSQGTANVIVSGLPAGGAGAWQMDITYDSSVVSVVCCSAFAGT